MRIVMIGTGYVGLVSGACFSEFGLTVICADIDADKISSLEHGEIPFYEPGLREKVTRGVAEGRLFFTTDVGDAIRSSEVVFIAVGTPANRDGTPNLDAIDAVSREIGRNLNGYKVVVTKSTVPPRTGERIRAIVEEEAGVDATFDIVSNPEFLREGSAIEDFLRPDRIVIGAESEKAVEIMKRLYGPLYLIETPFIVTDIATAEMIKYSSNAFLATKISFINEVANICELMGADIKMVIRAMGLDGRISSKFLHPGPGFGGSCFPKDVSALVASAKAAGYEFQIGQAVNSVNERQRELMVEKIRVALGDLQGKRVGILGLSFKPNTDDMRDSPSIAIIRGLQAQGATVKAYDPAAMENAKRILQDVEYCGSSYEVADGADALVLMTEWNQFRNLDFERLKGSLRAPIVIDLRNIYDPSRLREMGFKYYALGR